MAETPTMEEIEDLTIKEAQAEELKEFYRRLGIDEKGIDAFFLEVVRAEDTTKVGNLKEEEIGQPKLPILVLKELADDCDIIPSMSSFAKDFRKQSENALATSLSKEGFLIKARITQKKEFMDKAKRKIKRGWFGKKEEEEI